MTPDSGGIRTMRGAVHARKPSPSQPGGGFLLSKGRQLIRVGRHRETCTVPPVHPHGRDRRGGAVLAALRVTPVHRIKLTEPRRDYALSVGSSGRGAVREPVRGFFARLEKWERKTNRRVASVLRGLSGTKRESLISKGFSRYGREIRDRLRVVFLFAAAVPN
jgi:hypothetical protein